MQVVVSNARLVDPREAHTEGVCQAVKHGRAKVLRDMRQAVEQEVEQRFDLGECSADDPAIRRPVSMNALAADEHLRRRHAARSDLARQGELTARPAAAHLLPAPLAQVAPFVLDMQIQPRDPHTVHCPVRRVLHDLRPPLGDPLGQA